MSFNSERPSSLKSTYNRKQRRLIQSWKTDNVFIQFIIPQSQGLELEQR
jgi:hypothetical protein